MKLVLHVIAVFSAINLSAAGSLWTPAPVRKGQFEELTLEFSDAVSTPNNCSGYLDIVEQTWKNAARSMFDNTERGFLLQNITIAVPSNWDTSECGGRTFVSSVPKKPDVRIGPSHPDNKNRPWTEQSKVCGVRGDYISLSDAYFTDSSYTETERARLLFRMWMRYRIGVFDDTSCKLLTGSSAAEVCGISDTKWYEDKFADSKTHKKLCQNNPSTMMKNAVKDKFKSESYVEPTFTYKKPIDPKLVIAFDITMQKDEWNMTRAAFRSMLDYLTSDLELGLLGYYGSRSTQVYQDITLVTPNSDNFQNLTNKIDGQPKNFRRSNITRALEQAVQMLQADGSSAAGHSVFVIATKGSMNATELERATKFAEMAKIRVSVIAVGLEQDEFYHFALLTEKTDGQFHNATIQKIEDAAMNITYTSISLLLDIEDGLVSALRAHGKEVSKNLLYSTKLATSNAGNLKVYMEMYSQKSVFRIYVQTFDKKELAKSLREYQLLLQPITASCNVKPYRKDVYEATPEIWIHSYPAKNETCFPISTKWNFNVDRSQTEPLAYARAITMSEASNLTLKVETWFKPNATQIVVLATFKWNDMPVRSADVTAVIVPVDSAYPPREINLVDDGSADYDKFSGYFNKIQNKADIMKDDGVYTAVSSYTCGPSLVFVTAKIKGSSYVKLNDNPQRRLNESTLYATRTVNNSKISDECVKIDISTEVPTEPVTDPEEATITETESTVSTSPSTSTSVPSTSTSTEVTSTISSTLSSSSTSTSDPSTTTSTVVTSTKTSTVSPSRRTMFTRRTTTSTVTPSSTSTISSTTSTEMTTPTTTSTPVPSTAPSTVPSTSPTTQMTTQSTTASTPIPSTQEEKTTETEPTSSSTLSSSSTSTSDPSTTTSTVVTSTKTSTVSPSRRTMFTIRRTTTSTVTPSSTSTIPSTTTTEMATQSNTTSTPIPSTDPSTVPSTPSTTSSTTQRTTTSNMPTTLSTTVPSTTVSSTQTMETTTESSTMNPSEATSTVSPSPSTTSEETSTNPTVSTSSIVASTGMGNVETTEHASTELSTTSLAETTSKVNIGKKPKYSGLTRSTEVKPTSTVPTTSDAKRSSGNIRVVSVLTVFFVFWHLV